MEKLVTITIRNNSFIVSDIKRDVIYYVIQNMDRKLTTFTFEYNHKLRKRIRVPAKKFYISLEHIDTFVYSISLLKRFISMLYMRDIYKDEIDIIDNRDYKVDKLNLKLKDGYKPREKQKGYIDAILNSKNTVLIDARTGFGKAVDKNTPIITPNGYVKIKDLKIGDEVIGSNNKVIKVTGVYPQGKLQLYSLTFNVKEDYFTYNACKEHLWSVWLVNKKTKKEHYLTTDTESIIKLYDEYEIYVPTIYGTRSKLEVLDKGYISEAVCISVDSEDKLYALKGGVLTHNTFMSVYSLVKMNMKTFILVLPKYINKWIDDVKKYTNVKDEEIFVVRGGDSLATLIDNPKPYKFVIASVRTMVNYIKDFEKDEFLYEVTPFDLMEHLKIGIVLNDESHQEYHAVFRCMMYFNAKKLIGLSATLKSDDYTMTNMYKLLYPEDCRTSNLVKIKRYTIVKAVQYKIEDIRRLHFMSPQGYNHIKLEQSIMRISVLLKSYLDMIMYYVKKEYLDKKDKEDKLLIFCASVNMCTVVTNHIKELHKDLDVRRYVEEDPYENIIEADICVSSPQSAGTAIDIPNLRTVIQTVSIGSVQANIQSLGRLRELDGKDVTYVYLYSPDIDPQVKLELKRKNAIKMYAKEYHYYTHPVILKVR